MSLDSRKALTELARLLSPRPGATQLAVMKLGEAKRDGWTLADNDSLEAFTKVKVIHDGGNMFTLEIICQDADTLAGGPPAEGSTT